jgi:hypothetical protein
MVMRVISVRRANDNDTTLHCASGLSLIVRTQAVRMEHGRVSYLISGSFPCRARTGSPTPIT